MSVSLHAEELYKPLLSKQCLECYQGLNKKKLHLSFKVKVVDKNSLIPLQVKINGTKYEFTDASTFDANKPIQAYSLDLNNDGYDDLALKHTEALKNSYYLYFIFNNTDSSYKPAGLFPEFIKNADGTLSSVEYDGPKAIEKKYYIKDHKILEK